MDHCRCCGEDFDPEESGHEVFCAECIDEYGAGDHQDEDSSDD